jgi:hypothetical protein
VGADVAKATAVPSGQNVGAVGVDVVVGVGMRALGSMIAKETGVASEKVGALNGDAILSAATLAAPFLAEAQNAPYAQTPQRPLVMDVPADVRQPVMTTPERK